MTVARRVALMTAVAGWLYGWWLLRGVREEYSTGTLGPLPGGLFLFLVLSTFVAISAAVVAGFGIRAWPWVAIGAGAMVLAAILLAQYVPLREFAARNRSGPVGLDDVVRVALRNRTAAGVAVSTAIPLLLVLSGLSGLMLRPPTRRPLPPPRPAEEPPAGGG